MYRLNSENSLSVTERLDSSVVRVLARYAKGPGFDSRLRRDFFTACIIHLFMNVCMLFVFSTVE